MESLQITRGAVTFSADRAVCIEKAMRLILSAFEGQLRFGDACPMVAHSLRVGLLLEAARETRDTILVGFLHDVVEDTKITSSEIEEAFGSQVAYGVISCSHDQELYRKNPTEANLKLFNKVRHAGPEMVKVKMVDITDNLATYWEIPESWRPEMLWCGNEWLRLGREMAGENNIHSLRLECMLDKIRYETEAKKNR